MVLKTILFFLGATSVASVTVRFEATPEGAIGRRILAGEGDFDYSDGPLGPAHWADNFPLCGGLEQSPIDIPAAKAFGQAPPRLIDINGFTYLNEVTPISRAGNDVANPLTLVGASQIPFLVGRNDDSVGSNFTLAQFHFHWGVNNEAGSEHTFQGKHFPMELHLVNFNQKYGNISAALAQPDGLVVLGFLFDVADVADVPVDLNNVSVTDLLIQLNSSDFYAYPGSLTTPPCNEAVSWVVLQHSLVVSQATLDSFRDTLGANGVEIEFNFRPVMPGNGRLLFNSATGKSAVLENESSDEENNFRPLGIFLLVAACIVYFGLFMWTNNGAAKKNRDQGKAKGGPEKKANTVVQNPQFDVDLVKSTL